MILIRTSNVACCDENENNEEWNICEVGNKKSEERNNSINRRKAEQYKIIQGSVQKLRCEIVISLKNNGDLILSIKRIDWQRDCYCLFLTATNRLGTILSFFFTFASSLLFFQFYISLLLSYSPFFYNKILSTFLLIST